MRHRRRPPSSCADKLEKLLAGQSFEQVELDVAVEGGKVKVRARPAAKKRLSYRLVATVSVGAFSLPERRSPPEARRRATAAVRKPA